MINGKKITHIEAQKLGFQLPFPKADFGDGPQVVVLQNPKAEGSDLEVNKWDGFYQKEIQETSHHVATHQIYRGSSGSWTDIIHITPK